MTTLTHQLALACGISPLTKEARISPAKEQALIGRLAAKERALGEARTTGGAAYHAAPTLVEKEIQKQHSMPLTQQIGHKVRRGAKGLWSGRTGLGSKWGNRAALIGGLGILGGGLKAYLDSQSKGPEVPKLSPEAQPMPPAVEPAPSQIQQFTDADLAQYLRTMYPHTMGKMSAYSPSASGVPAPPASPKVTAPGPSVAGIPQLKPGEPPDLPTAGRRGGKSSVGPSAPKPPRIPKIAEDDALYPLLAAGAGAVGGHTLGSKIVNPLIKMKERALEAKIRNSQDILAALQQAQKKAPGMAAATGALLLAALTALAIKKKQGEKVNFNNYTPYDTSGGGFHPSQAQPFGSY